MLFVIKRIDYIANQPPYLIDNDTCWCLVIETIYFPDDCKNVIAEIRLYHMEL